MKNPKCHDVSDLYETDDDDVPIQENYEKVIESLRSRNERLVEGLKKAERIIWQRSDTYWVCCGGIIEIDLNNKVIGHLPDSNCWLAELLRENEG